AIASFRRPARSGHIDTGTVNTVTAGFAARRLHCAWADDYLGIPLGSNRQQTRISRDPDLGGMIAADGGHRGPTDGGVTEPTPRRRSRCWLHDGRRATPEPEPSHLVADRGTGA